MSSLATPTAAASLSQKFCNVRRQSELLCAPLSPEDMMVQSCAEASPAKWHLAHTTWFFETFILRELDTEYRPFHPDFVWLFNSYYNTVSDQPEKKLRASFSRPGTQEIQAYRKYVDAALQMRLRNGVSETEQRVVLGLHHEQQHQELLLTDIKHALWTNPLRPAYLELPFENLNAAAAKMQWCDYTGGLVEIGHKGDGFCFDNELPRHRVYLEPFSLASRLVTCAEYLAFMQDGGYQRSELWLSEGWQVVQTERWRAPLYWYQDADTEEWHVFTLRGEVSLNDLAQTAVCHVSYFEADAYARWAGKRLPTETEWEVAASDAGVDGNLLEDGILHPGIAAGSQIFGDTWEWTASAYLGYPGFHALPGALGEYNGKFMSNQMVLRGGSCVTPRTHIRASYRNFFSPATRWQFSGIRLAR
ncbi:ergothioneine biosynthesis protein EgtB [Alloacidobacterium sp.]|uniref:ergothioneine biosynthesis protein EgtB n=1 Tax=Alloacidobacterium sp. TaxID=2951999 RepID=UPI002D43515D|nr:ergothioneine biosynthesis protein EgtB [Alloacidobacterium sp.]HYK36978.1 ergothioneine biosynthesis protein EgtB [Alloacidobacterium sp.]